MKKIIALILILVVASPYSTLATDFTCTQVYYPIIVNGLQLDVGSLPVLNLNGNTYIPLRKIGEGSGLTVEWNADKQEVRIANASANALLFELGINILNETELIRQNLHSTLRLCNMTYDYEVSGRTHELVANLTINKDYLVPHALIDLERLVNYYNKAYLGKTMESLPFEPNQCLTLSKEAQQKIYELVDVTLGYLNKTYTYDHYRKIYDNVQSYILSEYDYNTLELYATNKTKLMNSLYPDNG
ncbi:MAG: hypothetical protein IJX50_00100 [Clostridia bacterium]|nr:hypothetical protein [Clostridia bacterium]